MEPLRGGIRCLLVAAALLVWVSCAKPLPDDKKIYIGTWANDLIIEGGQSIDTPMVHLAIFSQGKISYTVRKDGKTTTLNAPIIRFEDGRIFYGYPKMERDLLITEPPHDEGVEIWMTVDGYRVRLVTRSAKEFGK